MRPGERSWILLLPMGPAAATSDPSDLARRGFAQADVSFGREIGRGRVGLPGLRGPDPVAQLTGPERSAFVGSVAGRSRSPDPAGGVAVVAFLPVLPRLRFGLALIVDQELGLGIDGVLSVGERELEQLRLGDGLGRAGFDTKVAVDAPQEVDLVHEAVALARRHRGVGRIVSSPDVDAAGRTDSGAQLAPDAFLHAVLVAAEDVAAVKTLRLGPLLLRVLGRDPGLA